MSAISTVAAAAAQICDEAFFLDRIDDALIKRIRSSDYTCVDFETTGLTPFAKPVAMSKDKKIGGQSLARYKLAHPGCELNVRVRARIWSVALSDGSRLAWDLDKLSREDQARLIEASLDKQIVIGWNVGFDFAWAMSITKAWEPSLTIDVMLLARTLRPGLFWRVHQVAAKDVKDHPELLAVAAALDDEEDSEDEEDPFVSAALAIVRKSEASASLDAVSVALGLGKLDKSYQKPANWCVTTLSQGHYDYVMGDITAPVEVLRKLYPRSKSMDDIVNAISNEDEGKGREYLDIFERAPYELARIHARGLPVHLPTLAKIQEHRSARVPVLVEELITKHISELAEFKEKLTSARVSTTREMKVALGAYAKRNGCELGVGEDGSPIIQAKAAKLAGAFSLEGWRVWDELQHARKTLASCSEYELLSAVDREHPGWARVHPLISCAASTMRTTSKTPNAQNMERASDKPPAEFLADQPIEIRKLEWQLLQFRSMIRARPGHKIVLADYGQIELRIAAALATRCIKEIEAALKGELVMGRRVPDWIVRALASKTRPEVDGDFTLTAELWDLWKRVEARGATMAKIFRMGVDPHLYTGFVMALKQGVVELPEGIDTLSFLRTRNEDQLEALKKQIKTQRQGAKALNFGLLYGMGAESLWVQGIVAYGLTWTLEEAVAARDEWLQQLFPEIALWQLWHKLVHRDAKTERTQLLRRNKWKGNKLEVVDAQMRYGTTLGGRPFVDPDPRILNYQDQGTGASMAVLAIVDMPEPARSHIISFVHDEIVLEVPDHLVEVCSKQLEESMVRAGDRFLAHYKIPVEAAPEVSELWVKE